MRELFKYQAFGLNISSSFNIADLTQTHFSDADLHIKEGSVPETMQDYIGKGAFYYAAPGRFLFVMESIGRFWAQDGRDIIVEKKENVNERELNLFLLGSVIGATILQRGLTPIHGCTIIKDGTATILTGKSGAGKSSLAAQYLKEGYRLIADDISVVDIKNKMPIVKRGIQHLKLWEDTMISMDLETKSAERVRPSLNKYRKIYEDSIVPNDSELGTIIFLEVKNSKGFTINELHGIDKFNHVMQNIYRSIYIEPLGVSEYIFKTIAALLEKVKVFQVSRPITPLEINELRKFIHENIQ